jgi:secretion/DNA translocation related TadE-like protein
VTRLREYGSASVLTMAVGSAVLAGAGGLVMLVLVLTAQHRAASAADLAALAAASQLWSSPDTACAAASEVAAANHARLLSCEVAADSVVVSVGLVPDHSWLDAWVSQVVAHARGGYS